MFSEICNFLLRLDPVIISFGPIMIRWYSLAYIAGILIGYIQLKYILKKYEIFPKKTSDLLFENLITYIVIGIIIGGRLGFVLFYNLPKYLEEPLEIFKIWEGGMSFHGGLIGVITAIYILTRKLNISFWNVIDIIALTTPIGLFFGRIANFINKELWGRVTESGWGIIFPGTEGLPRHPSQLYEALGEGIILYIILNILAFKFRQIKIRGRISIFFLIFYSIIRFIAEFFREPDFHIGLSFNLSRGQFLCMFMFLAAIILEITIRKHAENNLRF